MEKIKLKISEHKYEEKAEDVMEIRKKTDEDILQDVYLRLTEKDRQYLLSRIDAVYQDVFGLLIEMKQVIERMEVQDE